MIRTAVDYVRRHHIGLVALMIALGGTAYAASSINSNDVKNDSLKGADIRNDSLTNRDIRDGSIKPNDLSSSGFPTATYSASVVNENGAPELLNNSAFTAVTRTAEGTYQLTLPPGGADCNFSLTPFLPITPTAPVLIYASEAAGDMVEITTALANGQPEDLGAAFGFDGFSILAVCPN